MELLACSMPTVNHWINHYNKFFKKHLKQRIAYADGYKCKQ